MTNRDESSVNEKEWRRICELVATESDPQRLSELVNQLLKELDVRRQALLETEKASESSMEET